MIQDSNIPLRIIIGGSSALALLVFFLFQNFDFVSFLSIPADSGMKFILNKSFRFILNDLLMIGIIYALFHKKKFVLFACLVQAAGILLFLIPYFILKLYFMTGNGPLVSFLHRLILNPTLMILLIPAFWIQMKNENRHEQR